LSGKYDLQSVCHNRPYQDLSMARVESRSSFLECSLNFAEPTIKNAN